MLSVIQWATGIDLAQESEVIVPAVSVRCEQLAKHNRKRQRDLRPGRGLIGVDAQGVRVTHRRKHTKSAGADCRALAQIQTVVEAPAPVASKAVDCLKVDYARERATEASVEDPGSIPGAYTSLRLIGPMADSKCLRRPEFANSAARTAQIERRVLVVTGGESAASTLVVEQSAHLSGVPGVATVNGTRQGTVASNHGQERKRNTKASRPMSCSPLCTQVEGGSPSGSAHPKQQSNWVRSAQQQESPSRLGSEDDCASGSDMGQSPAKQPADSTRRAA